MELESLICQIGDDPRTINERFIMFTNFIRLMHQNKASCEVCISDSKVIGYYILIYDYEEFKNFYMLDDDSLKSISSYLAQISIHQDYEGKGIGSTLLEAVEQRSKALGKTNLILEVNGNVPAHQWYKNRNYKEINKQVILSKNL
jgi:GNAT superfamily N-acetyltransferase